MQDLSPTRCQQYFLGSILCFEKAGACYSSAMPSRTVPNGDIGSTDFKRHLDEQKQTGTGLTAMYILVAGVVALAWTLGYFGFSSLWIFFLVSSLFVIWKSQTSKIIKKHLDYEEIALHRKRALRQSETVEWLNFLLNRW